MKVEHYFRNSDTLLVEITGMPHSAKVPVVDIVCPPGAVSKKTIESTRDGLSIELQVGEYLKKHLLLPLNIRTDGAEAWAKVLSTQDFALSSPKEARFACVSDPVVVDLKEMISRVRNVISAQEKRPMAERNNVYIVPEFIDWNVPLFQRPQQLALALAREGNTVIYCSPRWGGDKAISGDYLLEPNLYWTSNYKAIIRAFRGGVVLVYSTNPNIGIEDIRAIKRLGHEVVYEYVDHIDEKISAGWTAKLQDTFEKLTPSDALLFLGTAKLLEQDLKRRFGGCRVSYNPNACDPDHFHPNLSPANIWDAIAEKFPRKRHIFAGYFGALAEWLDYDLILSCVKANEKLVIVMVGPVYAENIQLPQHERIVYTGKIDYEKLPSIGIGFDIAIIPFIKGEIARSTSPLKLFEYYALGKPVVVTSGMEECRLVGGVFHGESVRDFNEAVVAAYSSRTRSRSLKHLREIAISNSWKARAISLNKDINSAFEHSAIATPRVKLNPSYVVESSFATPGKEASAPIGAYLVQGQVGRLQFAGNQIRSGDTVALRFDLNRYRQASSDEIGTLKFSILKQYENKEIPNRAVYEISINGYLTYVHPFNRYSSVNVIAVPVLLSKVESCEITIRVLENCFENWGWSSSLSLSVAGLEIEPGSDEKYSFSPFGRFVI